MRKPTALRSLVATLIGITLLTGCSLLGDGPKWGGKKGADKSAAAGPTLPEPTPTHTFEVDPTTDIVGVVQKTQAGKDDTLTDIARRFNVGYEEIVRANPGVDPWLPGENREIVIPSQFVLPNAPREGIVINAAAMRLFYYPKPKKGEKQVVHTYPIGIGKVGWKTPEGATKIVRRKKDPEWRPTPSIIKEHLKERGEKLEAVVKAGPDNPLGEYAMRLGIPGGAYLIHGTNLPAGVGMQVTHGCIRMYPEDIAELFKLVAVNTSVRLIDQPYRMGWHGEELYIEVHAPLEGQLPAETRSLTNITRLLVAATQNRTVAIDWAKAERAFILATGVPEPVLLRPATVQAGDAPGGD